MASVKTLSQTSLNEYFPEDALARIHSDFETRLAFLPPEIDQPLQQYHDILSAIQSVLTNKMDLAEFPFSQSSVATALLLFLLRSEPIRTLSWLKEKYHPTSGSLMIAAAFSGILYGRTIIPVECRTDASLELYIDEAIARKLNTISHGLINHTPSGRISLERSNTDGLNWEILKFPNQILVRREIRTPRKEAAVQQAKPEVRDSLLRSLLGSDLKSGPEKEAAIFLSRALGWDDCVTTILPLKGRRYVLNAADPQKPEMRISGFLNSSFEINVHADRFQKRLSIEVWNSLPERVLQSIADILRESDQSTSKTLDVLG